MKFIVREYGGAFVAVITAGMIFALCLNCNHDSSGDSWILSELSKCLVQVEKVYGTVLERNIYQEYSSRSQPVISCHVSGMFAGKEVNWPDIFRAVDADGNQLEVKILSVSGIAKIPEGFYFARSGVYSVEVATNDLEGKQTRQVFLIPVLPGNRKQ